jgi:hypothetical protein
MRTVEQKQVASAELGLSPSVQAALGELVNAAKDGLLALSVGVGLGVLRTLMEEEVSEVVGPKGRHDRDRSAVRHGSTGGEVTLGGRRVAVPRPRVRSVDGDEIELATYAHFADRDPLTRVVLEQMLAGVNTRRFERTREPVRADVQATERSASKSAASRAFVGRTGEHWAKRSKSPISAHSPTAVSVSTPRRQRSRPTWTAHGEPGNIAVISRSSASRRWASASIAPWASSIVVCAAGQPSLTVASQSRCRCVHAGPSSKRMP